MQAPGEPLGPVFLSAEVAEHHHAGEERESDAGQSRPFLAAGVGPHPACRNWYSAYASPPALNRDDSQQHAEVHET